MNILDQFVSFIYRIISRLKYFKKMYFNFRNPLKTQKPFSKLEAKQKLKENFVKNFPLKYSFFRKSLYKLNQIDLLLYCAASAMMPSNQEELSNIEYIATNALSIKDQKNKRSVSPLKFYKIYNLSNKIKYLEIFGTTFLEEQLESFSAKLENIVIRGTGRHPGQSFSVALRRFQAHNQWLKNHLGFTIEEAIYFTDKIINLIEERLGKIFESHQIKNKESLGNITLSYDQNRLFKIPNRKFVRSLKDVLFFDLGDLNITENKKSSLKNFLNRIADRPSKYIAQKYYSDEISLYNKPIIDIDGKYLLPFPSLLIEGLPEIFYKDLRADKNYWSRNAHFKGEAAEQRIFDMLGNVFLKDLIFTNPMKKKGIELIDAIVLFDDSLIVVESKSRYLSREARKDSEIINKYINETVKEGLDQASNAEKLIKSGSMKVLVNARGKKVTIDNKRIKKNFILLILDERISLMVTSDFIHKNISSYPKLPFIVDINDLEYIIEEFDTPREFIKYLEDRQKFLKSGKYHTPSELDLLGYYKIHGRVFSPIEGDEKVNIVVLDGFWDAYVKKYGKLQQNKHQADRISYFFDNLLERAHTAGNKSVFIAEELSKLTRTERRALSEKAFEKACLSAKDGKPHYAVAYFPSVDFGIVYIFSLESKEKRREKLQDLCVLASHKLKKEKIIGFATEPANVKITTFDYCLFNRTSELDPEMEELADKFFGPAVHTTENEYPSLKK